MTGATNTDQTGVGGGVITTARVGINTQSSGANITLTDDTKRIQRITMTAGSLELRLWDATTLSNGFDVIVDNVGGNNFSVRDNGGVTNIITAVAGSAYYVYLVSNATVNGTWKGLALAGGGASTGANSDITSLSGLTTTLTVGQGGTGLDADTTGGALQYVKQLTLGGAMSVGTIAAPDYPTMVGDAGAGGTKGAVPAPGAGDAAAAAYLSA